MNLTKTRTDVVLCPNCGTISNTVLWKDVVFVNNAYHVEDYNVPYDASTDTFVLDEFMEYLAVKYGCSIEDMNLLSDFYCPHIFPLSVFKKLQFNIGSVGGNCENCNGYL